MVLIQWIKGMIHIMIRVPRLYLNADDPQSMWPIALTERYFSLKSPPFLLEGSK